MLQVNDISPLITAFQNTYNFHIGHEFFGTIRKQQSHNHIGSTLKKAIFSVIQENKTKELVLCILCVGNEKGGSASLLFIWNKHCYIFDPHSRNSCGLLVDSGTSILASLKSRKNMILHICLINSLSQCSRQNPTDLYSMCVVSFNQVNIQMQNYFVSQKYQFLKSNLLQNYFMKKKPVKSERFETENKNSLHKQDIAKKKKRQSRKVETVS